MNNAPEAEIEDCATSAFAIAEHVACVAILSRDCWLCCPSVLLFFDGDTGQQTHGHGPQNWPSPIFIFPRNVPRLNLKPYHEMNPLSRIAVGQLSSNHVVHSQNSNFLSRRDTRECRSVN